MSKKCQRLTSRLEEKDGAPTGREVACFEARTQKTGNAPLDVSSLLGRPVFSALGRDLGEPRSDHVLVVPRLCSSPHANHQGQ